MSMRTDRAVIAAILVRPPPSLRELTPAVPPEFEAVIVRCLDKDRTRRFADVAELAEALRPFASQEAMLSVNRISRVLRVPASAATRVAPSTPGAPPDAAATKAPPPATAASRSRRSKTAA